VSRFGNGLALLRDGEHVVVLTTAAAKREAGVDSRHQETPVRSGAPENLASNANEGAILRTPSERSGIACASHRPLVGRIGDVGPYEGTAESRRRGCHRELAVLKRLKGRHVTCKVHRFVPCDAAPISGSPFELAARFVTSVVRSADAGLADPPTSGRPATGDRALGRLTISSVPKEAAEAVVRELANRVSRPAKSGRAFNRLVLANHSGTLWINRSSRLGATCARAWGRLNKSGPVAAGRASL
jgi:hypothetical protein